MDEKAHAAPPAAREDSASGLSSPGNLEQEQGVATHGEGQGQIERGPLWASLF